MKPFLLICDPFDNFATCFSYRRYINWRFLISSSNCEINLPNCYFPFIQSSIAFFLRHVSMDTSIQNVFENRSQQKGLKSVLQTSWEQCLSIFIYVSGFNVSWYNLSTTLSFSIFVQWNLRKRLTWLSQHKRKDSENFLVQLCRWKPSNRIFIFQVLMESGFSARQTHVCNFYWQKEICG